MLAEDKVRLRKQRHTTKRIFERLRDECGFKGGNDKGKVEELRFQFEKKLTAKPHEQALAPDEAAASFSKAQKMNKIADKLKRKFDYEHDNFLAALDKVPA